MKTVLFGPFVGELGWELVSWQGWVRDLSLTVYKDYHKVVSSYPGRYPLYPYADEYLPHPDSFISKVISPRGYITDWWKNGLPRGSDNLRKYKWGLFPRFIKKYVNRATEMEDVSLGAFALLDSYKKRFGPDALYFTPFLVNRCPKYKIKFGTEIAPDPAAEPDFKTFPIEARYQRFEKLSSSEAARKIVSSIIPDGKKIIAIFPRARKHRRPMLNWDRRNYEVLISMLQERFKEFTVAVFGEPEGAYFADAMPEGCLDLINVEPGMRMDIQIAALDKAAIAIGGISGAILLALACGCPSLTFGVKDMMNKYHSDNPLKTRFVYYPYMFPEPEEIFSLAEGMLKAKIPPHGQELWQPLSYFSAGFRIRKRFSCAIEERIKNFVF